MSEGSVSTIEKPSTQKEMTEQLWYAVIGSNGEGLSSRVARIEQTVNAHQSWHATNKITTILALFGWIVALGAGALAIL